MSNKKILLKILEELKKQNEVLKKLASCIRDGDNFSKYLNTRKYP